MTLLPGAAGQPPLAACWRVGRLNRELFSYAPGSQRGVFAGDSIMIFFNDPVPIPNPSEKAVRMSLEMQRDFAVLASAWKKRGYNLNIGIGVAQGYATLGQIGFSERSGYTAIGTVCNVAARLCAEAKDGQILLSQRVNVALKGSVATEQVGALALKGLTQPVVAYNVPLAPSNRLSVLSKAAHKLFESDHPPRSLPE